VGGAYIINHVAEAVGDHSTEVHSLARVLNTYLSDTGIRSTDLHDIAVAADDASADGPVASCLAGLEWPGRPTFGFFARGMSSALDALAYATLGALTEHRHLTLVLAVGETVSIDHHDGGQSTRPSPGAGMAVGLMVASEYFVRRSSVDVEASVCRVVSAAHPSGRSVDALYEAVIRLLLNEYLNPPDIDAWHIWLSDDAQRAALLGRLGLMDTTVTDYSATWPHNLSTVPAALWAVTNSLKGGSVAGPWTAVTLFPALDGGALAVLTRSSPFRLVKE
jgi:hypothetical protein